MSKKLVKRIYERFTPYVQVLGWAAIVIPAVYTASVGVDKALAFDSRLTAMEQAQTSYKYEVARLNGKIEDIMDFFRVPRRKSLEVE